MGTWQRSLLLSSALSVALFAPALFAQDSDATASVHIDQQSPLQTIGTWTLLFPDNEKFEMNAKDYTLKNLVPGRYTLFIEPPQGTTTSIIKYLGDQVADIIPKRQLTFMIGSSEEVHFVISYKLTNFGKIGVSSTPKGIPFTITGPEEFEEKGVTPAEFTSVPVGQYAIQYAPPGCTPPPSKSSLLEKNGRIDFSIEFNCEGLKPLEDHHEEMSQYISITIDGKTIYFQDVPESEWYATYVYDAMKVGILSGYRNDTGNLTGRFGPDNPLTVAELAKIAHKLADIDETHASLDLVNPSDRRDWSAPFIASAISMSWVVYTDPQLNIYRPATRAEVIATLLQAMDVPVGWPKGKIFTDVTPLTPYASAIETAASGGLITGLADDNGNTLGIFAPGKLVNRAELAKIVTEFIKKYRAGSGIIIEK